MRLKDIGEERLIRELAERFSSAHPRLTKAIGDDTSVSTQTKDRSLLVTTDLLIEGTHFIKSRTTAYLLGRKSLSISLSDIAAMGGAPLFYLVSVALPPQTRKTFVDELYRGLHACASESGAHLAGGNTAANDRIMVSTTVLGEADPKRVVYRSGAKAGDIIYVTGTLGDSALGLEVLLKNSLSRAMKSRYRAAVMRHLDPTPRLRAGALLAKGGLASAMMDISDGLGLDLERLCAQSGVNAIVELGKVPVSDELARYASSSEDALIRLAVSGGEDYELLFTSPEKNDGRIRRLARRLSVPITRIGRIIGDGEHGRGRRRVAFTDRSGKAIHVKKAGFVHF